jgi:hypothetical protein
VLKRHLGRETEHFLTDHLEHRYVGDQLRWKLQVYFLLVSSQKPKLDLQSRLVRCPNHEVHDFIKVQKFLSVPYVEHLAVVGVVRHTNWGFQLLVRLKKHLVSFGQPGTPHGCS